MTPTEMTKAELLEQVASLSASPSYAIELAKTIQSDEDCRNQRKQAITASERFEKMSSRTIGIFALVVFTTVSVLLFNTTITKPDANVSDLGKAFMAGWFGIMTAGAVFCLSMAVKIEAVRSKGFGRTAHLLSPVTGTGYCEQGAAALKEGGHLPAQWRDLALKDRSQLHVFDVLIMTALAERERARAAASKREQACRALHDLPNPA